jgi:integrase/recombinase XerD
MKTTEMYTRADPSVKLDTVEAMIAQKLRSGRFKAPDDPVRFTTLRLKPRLAKDGKERSR